jgi:ribosomal protein S18 acetylase RimI-like enzyme
VIRITDIQSASHKSISEFLEMYEALHKLNASFNPIFTLARNWRSAILGHIDDGLSTVLMPDNYSGFVRVMVVADPAQFGHRGWCELCDIYVKPKYRGRGVGKELVQAAFDWAKEFNQGYDDRLVAVKLFVSAQNEQAKALYRSMGMQPVQEVWIREDYEN